MTDADKCPPEMSEMTDTDRELLELAAKAAGMHVLPENWPRDQDGWFYCLHHGRPAMHFRNAKNPHARSEPWSPPTDDGDAFRLMVALRFVVNVTDRRVYAGDADGNGVTLDIGRDPCAATRRAIFRAAAEIGRML